MGTAFHMPCPLKQWFSTCHCPYGLPRLWDPLPLPYLTTHWGSIARCIVARLQCQETRWNREFHSCPLVERRRQLSVTQQGSLCRLEHHVLPSPPVPLLQVLITAQQAYTSETQLSSIQGRYHCHSLSRASRNPDWFWFFTARCTIVKSAVLRSHVVCPSVCDVGGSGPHRLKISEINCANNQPNIFTLRSPKVIHLFPGEHGEILGRLELEWEKVA